MEANRFCNHCGRALQPGARFCFSCGAEWQPPAEAVAALTAPVPAEAPQAQPTVAQFDPQPPIATPAVVAPGRFCPNCGAQIEAGLSFCTRCGANLQVGSAPQPAVPPAAKKPWLSGIKLYGAIAVAALVLLGVIGALFGEDEKSGDKNTSPEPQARATAQPFATVQAAATPRATASATAAPRRGLNFADLTPIALNLPPIQGEELGSRNVVAEAQVRQAISTVIPDLRGVQISVHRWLGKTNSLLVVDMDEAAAKRFPSDPNPILKAITASPAIQRYNITEVALLTAGRDNQGTYTITASMSLTTATALAANQLSQQQIKDQVQASMTRP